MGYCYSSDYKFNTTGWRIAYVSDGTAYLTSAGSPECMCTDSSGNANTSCSSNETTAGVPNHLANLNSKALTYCNSTYAYSGVCDSTSAWNMNASDFEAITGVEVPYLTEDVNLDAISDIINNGSYYWFWNGYFYNASDSHGGIGLSGDSMGIRPILRLKASVKITGGSGTMGDPYTISPS